MKRDPTISLDGTAHFGGRREGLPAPVVISRRDLLTLASSAAIATMMAPLYAEPARKFVLPPSGGWPSGVPRIRLDDMTAETVYEIKQVYGQNNFVIALSRGPARIRASGILPSRPPGAPPTALRDSVEIEGFPGLKFRLTKTELLCRFGHDLEQHVVLESVL